jgi:predicted ester cyclase
MSEENKVLVRRSWAESGHNLDILDEVYTPDALWHLPDQDIQGVEDQDIQGVEDFKQYLTSYLTAFPDANVTVEDEIAEGDKVVNRFTIRGTHQGEIEEFGPPTGRQMEQKGMAISRIEGGKIVEEWQAYDNLGVRQQLGLAPEQ